MEHDKALASDALMKLGVDECVSRFCEAAGRAIAAANVYKRRGGSDESLAFGDDLAELEVVLVQMRLLVDDKYLDTRYHFRENDVRERIRLSEVGVPIENFNRRLFDVKRSLPSLDELVNVNFSGGTFVVQARLKRIPHKIDVLRGEEHDSMPGFAWFQMNGTWTDLKMGDKWASIYEDGV